MVKNWSDRVEELLDDGDGDGAARFLEGIVEEMRSSQGEEGNLSLAAAMEDLGALYERQGLSLKADSLRGAAIVIRHRLKAIDDGDKKAGDDDEEDWEKAACDPPKPPPSPTDQFSRLHLDEAAPPRRGRGSTMYRDEDEDEETGAVPKQRGRGAFTYGKKNGFHSDDRNRDDLPSTSTDDVEEIKQVVYGASHVLVLTGFSPKTTTIDLEKVVLPFASRGVAIRWVNDTTALAVFRNPATAREALATIRHPSVVVKAYDDCDDVHSLVSEQELEPPAPRPATSTRAAQRMIMGALTKQGMVRRAQARISFTAQELQKQEEERKKRLLAREKLREEAWGSD